MKINDIKKALILLFSINANYIIKQKMEEQKMNKKGITLISLVITIIIMLILAGIVITLTIGENGIINKAQIASQHYLNAQNYEENQVAKVDNTVESYINSSRNDEPIVIDGNEHVIGSFYGKPLYRKSFTGTTPNSGDSNFQDLSDLNISICTDISGTVIVPNGTHTPIGYYNHTWYLSVAYDSANKSLAFRGHSDFFNQPYYLTIEYTKTTD